MVYTQCLVQCPGKTKRTAHSTRAKVLHGQNNDHLCETAFLAVCDDVTWYSAAPRTVSRKKRLKNIARSCLHPRKDSGRQRVPRQVNRSSKVRFVTCLQRRNRRRATSECGVGSQQTACARSFSPVLDRQRPFGFLEFKNAITRTPFGSLEEHHV